MRLVEYLSKHNEVLDVMIIMCKGTIQGQFKKLKQKLLQLQRVFGTSEIQLNRMSFN